MAELKTKRNDASVTKFIASVDKSRQDDCNKLLKLFTSVTKEKPVMWGSSIIGFGLYHYKSASGREGDWMLTGFSPRKQNITLYIISGVKQYNDLLKDLGKYKVSGGSCLYINKLSDIDTAVLKKIIIASVKDLKLRQK